MVTTPLRPNYMRTEISGGAYGYLYPTSPEPSLATAFRYWPPVPSDGVTDTLKIPISTIPIFSRVLLYTSSSAGLFDMQAGYQRRDFGSNGFYSLSFPRPVRAYGDCARVGEMEPQFRQVYPQCKCKLSQEQRPLRALPRRQRGSQKDGLPTTTRRTTPVRASVRHSAGRRERRRPERITDTTTSTATCWATSSRTPSGYRADAFIPTKKDGTFSTAG